MYGHHTLTCLLCHIPSPQVVLNGSSRPAPKQHHMTPADIKDRLFMHCFFSRDPRILLSMQQDGGKPHKRLRFSLALPRKKHRVELTSSSRWIPWSLAQHVPEVRFMIHIWLPKKITPSSRPYPNFLVFWSQDKSNKDILHIYLLFQF